MCQELPSHPTLAIQEAFLLPMEDQCTLYTSFQLLEVLDLRLVLVVLDWYLHLVVPVDCMVQELEVPLVSEVLDQDIQDQVLEELVDFMVQVLEVLLVHLLISTSMLDRVVLEVPLLEELEVLVDSCSTES